MINKNDAKCNLKSTIILVLDNKHKYINDIKFCTHCVKKV